MLKTLHHYQLTAIDHILNNPKCGLFLDMGLGKTVSTLTAVRKLIFEEIEISRVLVIAPKRVAESVWGAEIENWPHLKGLRAVKITGTEMQRKAALKEKGHIYLISRDNVAWLCGQYGGSTLPFDMLVIDESSSFKNPKSLRFKALKAVSPSFDRVILLTGTPAPNSLIDLWSQIYLLDRGERLGRFITQYRKDFFTPGQSNGHIVYNYKLQKGGEKAIHEKIGDICMSMKTEDYLELPERIDNFIKVKFPDEVQSLYDDFEREKVLQLFEDNEVSAINAAALSNKLLQFANGAVYDENKYYHEVHSLKLDALEDLIEEANGQPVLIAWTYRHDRDRILRKLKSYKPRELKTDKDIKDWNSGKIQVLTMHPASGGHGLNLQHGGNTVVWFGQTWSLELYQQLNKRLHRQGQTKPVIVHHLIGSKTIDEDVMKALKRKEAGQSGLMEAIKARINKYQND